jgi:predicted transcriptional regulator
VKLTEGEYLMHYGILRRSGRYPWGSGSTPLQRSKRFLDILDQHMKVDGMTESEIAKAYSTDKYPMSVADLRATKSRAGTEVKMDQIRTAERLRDKGMGASAIARQMDVNESTVRSLLEPGRKEKLDTVQKTADMLKRQVEEKEMIDVGSNVNLDLPISDNPSTKIGISPDKFNTALSMLKEEGYNVHTFKSQQVGTGEMTTYKVLVKPGVTQKEAWLNRDNVRLISEKTDDGGHTYTDFGIVPPLSVSSKRVGIRYKEDGGADADGVIYVRPGVPDVTLGKSRYAQVRVAIDNSHFLKGMAVYKDDLPKGIDLQFNTNKSDTGNKHDAMKPLKRDPKTGEVDKDNPFGAVIKEGGQILDKNGKARSAMNIINEEGDWDKWSRTLSSQVLSKQKPELIESQLNLTYDRRRSEFEEIKGLTNPQIKRKLLETFGDETDAAAVHLKAANMPRQATKVILPSNHVKHDEIFAPTFKDGEKVALVRFPHAGTFEIPELTVNNRSRKTRALFGGKADVPDAVAIHPRVAEHLSGADFDGDHVVVIPNNRGNITSKLPLEGLKGFEPRASFGPYDGMKTIDGGIYRAKTKEVDYGKDKDGNPRSPNKSSKQNQMGNVTNLISDMTIRGANNEELARAVRHSMVVIDSEKHVLDYKASERANGILDLKRRYQGVNPKTGQPRGASTLITRAGAEYHVPRRKPRPAAEGGPIDKATGKKVFVETGKRRRDGKIATFESKRLAETEDAYTLVSKGRGTRVEQIYADHSNRLKALGNEVRREQLRVKSIPYSPSANKLYSHEVDALKSKLNLAERNAPLERQAQAVARRIVADRKRANPAMEKDEERKIRGQALTEARRRTGAGKTRLGSKRSPITNREWEAIQAGAISNHMLDRILKNADLDAIRKRATPRENPVMTSVMITRAKQMLASGYTMAEVSDHLGIAQSTLKSGVA